MVLLKKRKILQLTYENYKNARLMDIDWFYDTILINGYKEYGYDSNESLIKSRETTKKEWLLKMGIIENQIKELRK